MFEAHLAGIHHTLPQPSNKLQEFSPHVPSGNPKGFQPHKKPSIESLSTAHFMHLQDGNNPTHPSLQNALQLQV